MRQALGLFSSKLRFRALSECALRHSQESSLAILSTQFSKNRLAGPLSAPRSLILSESRRPVKRQNPEKAFARCEVSEAGRGHYSRPRTLSRLYLLLVLTELKQPGRAVSKSRNRRVGGLAAVPAGYLTWKELALTGVSAEANSRELRACCQPPISDYFLSDLGSSAWPEASPPRETDSSDSQPCCQPRFQISLTRERATDLEPQFAVGGRTLESFALVVNPRFQEFCLRLGAGC